MKKTYIVPVTKIVSVRAENHFLTGSPTLGDEAINENDPYNNLGKEDWEGDLWGW